MITGRGGSAGRRGQIRPPRRPVVSPAANRSEFDVCWDRLREGIHNIHTQNAGNLSFEQLYRCSYKIVTLKAGMQLYHCVKTFEEGWFTDSAAPPITSLITKNLVSITLDGAPGISVVERRAMGEKFLRGLRSAWENHSVSMNMIADVLMYLDRSLMQEYHQPSIYTVGIGFFRDHILQSNLGDAGSNYRVFDILNATIVDQLNMERQGDVIDKALVRSCISMLEGVFETNSEAHDQRLYLTTFEPYLLQTSHEFYRLECERLLRDADASAWLRQTEARLREESIRCQTTLSSFSDAKMCRVVQEELITKHMDEFLQLEGSGLRVMIDNDRVGDLRILHTLISLVDEEATPLRNMLSVRIMEMGHEIEQNLKNTDFSVAPGAAVADEPAGEGEKPKTKTLSAAAQATAAAIKWVDDVLRLKDKFDRLWVACFDRRPVIETSMTRSFTSIVNGFDRASEFLSLYIDDNLRRGLKGKTEAEVDVVLDKALTLLRHLSDRDKFEAYYQKHLARRLLHGKSESHDVEQEMISRMKRELGNNFTQKFEGMFRDMNTSRETAEQYRNHVRDLDNSDEGQIDLSISILAGNNWPREVMGKGATVQPDTAVKTTYPPEIQKLQEDFFAFYSKTRNGRVLTWIGTAGTADIKCIFPKTPGKTSGPLSKDRRYEINVSTYGMVVLMLFNDINEDEWISFEDIQAATSIPQPDLINTLTSLSVIKQYRVLVKKSQTKSAAQPGDEFTFNREFISKAIKIKIPSVNAANRVENDDEKKHTDEKTLETRKHVADSVIVRIMKQRKELSHTQLVNEVIQVLSGRFKPDMSLIKGQIESLISREYMERAEQPDGSPSDRYKYVA